LVLGDVPGTGSRNELLASRVVSRQFLSLRVFSSEFYANYMRLSESSLLKSIHAGTSFSLRAGRIYGCRNVCGHLVGPISSDHAPLPAFKANGKIDGEILSTLVPCRSNRAQKLQPQNVRTSCTGKIACPGRPYQLVR